MISTDGNCLRCISTRKFKPTKSTLISNSEPLRRATSRALSLISQAHTSALDILFFSASAIQPLPVPTSKIFILGRQMGHALALEGALKIKEVSYLHAEGYPGGALKHGPFALIESTTPIIILAFRDNFSNKMHITAEEVKARGCPVILITDLIDDECKDLVKTYDYIIKINHIGYLSPLLGIIPLQYLAYQLSVGKGYNPDYPRNLAKCVTTE